MRLGEDLEHDSSRNESRNVYKVVRRFTRHGGIPIGTTKLENGSATSEEDNLGKVAGKF